MTCDLVCLMDKSPQRLYYSTYICRLRYSNLKHTSPAWTGIYGYKSYRHLSYLITLEDDTRRDGDRSRRPGGRRPVLLNSILNVLPLRLRFWREVGVASSNTLPQTWLSYNPIRPIPIISLSRMKLSGFSGLVKMSASWFRVSTSHTSISPFSWSSRT